MIDIQEFKSLLCKAKSRLIQMHYETGIGHLGGNLSCLDIILWIHHNVLDPHDIFILSKGHSVGALYITLWTKDVITDEQLNTFHGEGTILPGHPPVNKIDGIPFATGSLGHGLSLAAGLALGLKIKKINQKVICLLSDGELNEGSTWEAFIFISHHKLPVKIIIDHNHWQGFGRCEEILNLNPLQDKFEAFGFKTATVDGHDPSDFSKPFQSDEHVPLVIISESIKGKGIKKMEGTLASHYLPLDEKTFNQALIDLEKHEKTVL